MTGKIFINYRRDDSIGMAGRLHDRLAQTFGRDKLFMDVDHIPVGEDFVTHLNNQVAACDVVLVVIGPSWLRAKDKAGQRRLQQPDDFVAIEIAAALARSIRVIPVLVDGARMPKESELPDSLKPLVRRQAAEVRHSHFGRDAETLIASMREAVPALSDTSDSVFIPERNRGSAAPHPWRKKSLAGAALAAVLLLIGVGGYAFIQRTVEKSVQRSTADKAEQKPQARVVDESEAKRKADEAERQRLATLKADQERQARAAAEAEAKRKADEAERQRLADLKADQERQARAAAEAEAKRKADEAERQRLAALKAEEDRRRAEAPTAPAPPPMPQSNAATATQTDDSVPIGDALLLNELRDRLYELNFDPVSLDGPLTDANRKAIREFQQQINVSPTGIATMGLVRRLRELNGLKPWASIVFGKDTGKWGMAWDESTRKAAVARARVSCGDSSACPVEVSFFGTSCGAFAYSGASWAITARDDIGKAKAAALADCGRHGKSCQIVASVCANGAERFSAK
jgi:cytoskeletal protein RodZ